MFSEALRVGFRDISAVVEKVALGQFMIKMQAEAIASMLMASAVNTALLKEVRAFVSVGGGGRGW